LKKKDDITEEKDLKDYEINIIKDAKELDIENLEEFNKFINKATNKTFGFQSHIILRLTLIVTYNDGSRHVSIANFVDLAPMNDHNVNNNNNYDNKPLAKFEDMISIVSTGNICDKRLYPSLLTKLLNECIGGNCKTAFVLTATPHKKQLSLTKQCFEFGKKIKNIKNQPKQNCDIPNEILNKYLEKIKKQNDRKTSK